MDLQELVKSLTVDEKIRLLNGVGDWHTYDANGKLKTIMMTDGPHGIRKVENEKTGDINGSNKATCFPTASAIASSWNPQVAARMARHIATEAIDEDISIVLGCGINIKRSPLCGRNFEYFSEDPFLTAQMATAYIKAMQESGVGTSLKHFAANSQETRRMTSNSEIDERTLREIYLYAFEQVVKNANPTTIMASYNKINGEYACANSHLLQDILRGEWGYEGVVVSDWGACVDAVKCFNSGLNLEMPDNRGYHYQMLCKAYEEGQLSEDKIDELALKIVELVYGFTLPDKNGVDYDSQHSAAREFENECAILLKNSGNLLPISKEDKIIVIGELAEKTRFQGGGSSHINPARYTNGITGLTDAGYALHYIKGYEVDTDKPNDTLEREALQSLEAEMECDNGHKPKILFFLGLTDIFEGEGYDRTTLCIPENQTRLLKKVSEKYGAENIAAITFGGAPMDYSFDAYVSSVLHMHLGGQAVGDSIADLISGKVNPSGRLAETLPLCLDGLSIIPSSGYFAPKHDDVEYRESIFVGYRYYETFGIPVSYAFGWGLSYTDFEYTSIELPDKFDTSITSELEVKVDVKNIGSVAGAEVVQLYVCPPGVDLAKSDGGIVGDFIRSRKELKGFAKVYLEPGETKTVSIMLDASSFAVYDVEKGRWSPIGGEYTVAAGKSVADIELCKTISVVGETYSRNERALFPEYFEKERHLSGMNISQDTFAKLYGGPLSDFKSIKRGQYTIQSSFGDVSRQSLFGKIIRGVIAIGIKFMFSGKKKNSPEMKMVLSGIEEGSLEGLIANSGGIVSPKLIEMLVFNANKQYGKAIWGKRKC